MYRLSMLDLVDNGSDWTEIEELAQAVEQAGASIINTGIGWHEARIPHNCNISSQSCIFICDGKVTSGSKFGTHEHISRGENTPKMTTTTDTPTPYVVW